MNWNITENALTTFSQSLVRKVRGQPYEQAKCFRCGEDCVAKASVGRRFNGVFGGPSKPSRLRAPRIGCCDDCFDDDEFMDHEITKTIRFTDGSVFETFTEPPERVNAD